MATLTDYKGLDVVESASGAGGEALTDDFKELADRAPYHSASDPTTGDDSGDSFAAGSLWFNTTSQVMWVCTDATSGSAKWRSLLKRTDDALILSPSDPVGGIDNRAIQVDGDASASARGTGAVDLQSSRSSNSEVASGNRSAIGGGKSNTASGHYATVGGGSTNSAVYCATVGGGDSNAATGDISTITGGYSNTASGHYATVPGGGYAKADKYGQQAYASGRFAAQGDAQTSKFVVREEITHSDANWQSLFLDGSSADMTVATDTVWTFDCLLVGTTEGCSKSFGFAINGVIENDGGTTTMLASNVTTLYDTDDTSFDAQAIADNTDDSLKIQVKDADGNSDVVRWVAVVRTAEVTYEDIIQE